MTLKTLLLPALFAFSAIQAQEVIFKSPKSFTDDELYDFYCSFRMEGNKIFFNAPDYMLYAFDKADGTLKWERPLRYKTNHAPRIVDHKLWANASGAVEMINMETGEKIRDLPLGSIESEPLVRNGIVYATGILDGGRVYAYDLEKDSVTWSRFIAHGCSRQPYYPGDRIIANAEGDKWIELNYNGTMMNAGCNQEEEFESGSPCVRNFAAITHDGSEIIDFMGESAFYDHYGVPSLSSVGETTFAFHKGELNVYGNRLRKKAAILLEKLVDQVDWDDNSLQRIVKLEGDRIWIVYSNRLFILDHRKKKLVRMVDLTQWEPHQVQEDNGNLWLISKLDGRLYGLSI